MKKLKLKKRSLKLKADHQLPMPPPGYVFMMLGKGDVHLFVPRGWEHGIEESGWMRISDQPFPNENCRVKIIYLKIKARIPPAEFKQITTEQARNLGQSLGIEFSPLQCSQQNGLQLAWYEGCYTDRLCGRTIRNRNLAAFGNGIHANFVFEFWDDEAEKYLPVWDTILKGLKLGEFVPDPTTGRVVRPHLN